MKLGNKFLGWVLLLVAPLTAFAQATASTSIETRAVIINPITITKTQDLDFGNIVSSYSGGTVTINPNGIRTVSGVAIASSSPGNVSAAQAIISHGDALYNVTFPESIILYNASNPDQTLLITDFISEPIVNNPDSDILRIGATLNVEANQVQGYYSNPDGFNVTVSYD